MGDDDIIVRTRGELNALLGLHAGSEVSLPPIMTLGSAPFDSSHFGLLGKMYNLRGFKSFQLLMKKIEANSVATTIKKFPPELRLIMTDKKTLKGKDGICSLFNMGGDDEDK